MITVPRPILAFALLATVLAACSGGGAAPSGVATLDDPAASAAPDASGSPAPSISPEDAMLAFAKCMREHGINMPDPEFGTGGSTVMIGGDGIAFDSPTFKAADEACRSIMTDAMPGIVGSGPGTDSSGPGAGGTTVGGGPNLHVETAQ